MLMSQVLLVGADTLAMVVASSCRLRRIFTMRHKPTPTNELSLSKPPCMYPPASAHSVRKWMSSLCDLRSWWLRLTGLEQQHLTVVVCGYHRTHPRKICSELIAIRCPLCILSRFPSLPYSSSHKYYSIFSLLPRLEDGTGGR